MRRRTLLQLLLSLAAALPARIKLWAQAPLLSEADKGRIRRVAEIVLPRELGDDGRERVVAAFFRWLQEYRAGAEMDHGYGFTRLRKTGPSPADKYPSQLDALYARAQASGGLAAMTEDARRAAIEAAVVEAKVERLPARPDGGHIATDLMAFYFNSVEATDLAYHAAIGRDLCRGLDGSENRPSTLPTGVR